MNRAAHYTHEQISALVSDLYEAAGLLRRRGDRIAGVADQTQARWQLLTVVLDGDWTVPHIARRLGLSRQAVQRVADDLRADGLVSAEANPYHQRSSLIRLTDAGRAALAAINAEAAVWDAQVFDTLNPSDLDTTRRVLRAMIDAAG